MLNEDFNLQPRLVPLKPDQRYKITIDNFPAEWGEWANAETAMLILTAMALMHTNVVCREDLIALLRKDFMARLNLPSAVAQIDEAIEVLCGEGLVTLNARTGDIIPRPELFVLVSKSKVIVTGLTASIGVDQIDEIDAFNTIEL